MTIIDHTPEELMTVVASRLLREGDVCFVGIGVPSAACNLARLTHAPDLVLIYESGTLETRPDVLPLSIGDGELSDRALTTVSVVEMFQYWLQGGRISKGFLSGAQVDRYANVNTTVIGDYAEPVVRLPGAGGAPEMVSACGEVVIMINHSRRSLVDRVDFVTSFGHGRGAGDRARHGLSTAGPVLVITDLCTFVPHPESAELTVASLHAGVTRRAVQEATGWDVRFMEEVGRTSPPTGEELDMLRALQARTAQVHARE